ncbi:MAG: hypothetical protein WDZ44_01415, partial [Candidatus Spechtbacterales bacterium]
IDGSLFDYTATAGLGATIGDPLVLTTFNAPLTLSIRPPSIPDPASVAIHFLHEGTQQWVPLPTTYEERTKTFSALTTHFTLFALIQTTELPEEQPQEPPQEQPQDPSLADGDLITTQTSPDIYIVKITPPSTGSGQANRYRRLILNPTIFDSYGHLRWEDVKTVSQETLDTFTTSTLVIEVNPEGTPVTNKVYTLTAEPNSDTGIKRWLDMTAERFTTLGYQWLSIFTINHIEAGPEFYGEGIGAT